jgi:hypothetical protein
MSTACYTNRVRTRAQARVTKVQYPGNIAINYDPLYATNGCNPRFNVINYYIVPKTCLLPCVPTIVIPPPTYVPQPGGNAYTGIFDAGFADSSMPLIVDGNEFGPPPNVYAGDGNATTTIFSGGNADPASVSNNILTSEDVAIPPDQTLDGRDSEYFELLYTGGTVIQTATVILSGGNSNI